MSPRVVVAGVSGSGKSTVGELLAERLDVPFEDGDDLHPPENKAKMKRGDPLTDEDRRPWLDVIGHWFAEHDGGVVACSALRRTYRDRLREHAPDVDVLLLDGEPELLAERQANRKGHFMPPGLMDSQLATLELIADDERGVVIDVGQGVEEIVAEYVARRT